MTAVHIETVSMHFGRADDAALREVSLAVKPGELLVLLGPSGSGKTTLLRCVAGLIEPSGGSIRIGDHRVMDRAAGINVSAHKRGLGMVFQNFALWPHMTVRQNVAYPIANRAKAGEARVMEMLSLVRCEQYADRLPSMLSGGQQQRISLARALAGAPAVLLFDEPLSNLDALLRVELRAQLRHIHRMTGFTGIYVTHDQAEALSLGTRVAVMNRGRIEQIGTPRDIYRAPASEFVAEFMGMGNQLVLEADGSRRDGSGQRVLGFAHPSGQGAASATAVRFRPESLMLGATGDQTADAANLVIPDLEVVDGAFCGEYVEYSLRSGPLLLRARPGRGCRPHQIGERVNGYVPRADAACFAA